MHACSAKDGNSHGRMHMLSEAATANCSCVLISQATCTKVPRAHLQLRHHALDMLLGMLVSLKKLVGVPATGEHVCEENHVSDERSWPYVSEGDES